LTCLMPQVQWLLIMFWLYSSCIPSAVAFLQIFLSLNESLISAWSLGRNLKQICRKKEIRVTGVVIILRCLRILKATASLLLHTVHHDFAK